MPYSAPSILHDFGYVAHHPIVDAYVLHEPPPHERPTWDLTSVLAAVRSESNNFDLSPPGEVRVENDGFTRFTPKNGGRDRYLVLTDRQAPRVREALIQLVCQPPAGGRKQGCVVRVARGAALFSGGRAPKRTHKFC